MKGQSSSFDPITARARVRHGSALLLSVVVVFAGCASDERLSLGQHYPPSARGPAVTEGAAGGAALDTAGQAAPANPDPSQAGAPALPQMPPRRPLAPPPPDASIAEPSADAAVQGIPCAPGTYAAELVCAVDPSMLPPNTDPRASSPMRATVAFTVEPTATPEQLEVRGGTLRFQYMGLAFEGRLEGGLDCASSAFHADIVDGYAAQYPGAPMPLQFEGAIDGMLDPSAPMLSGSWWHGPAVPEPRPSCVGPWTARLQEP